MNKIKKDNKNYTLYIEKKHMRGGANRINLINELKIKNIDNFNVRVTDGAAIINSLIALNILVVLVKFNIKNEVAKIKIVDRSTENYYILSDFI